MPLFRALACISVVFNLGIVNFTAANYTYITNAMVEDVYTAAGYTTDYVKRQEEEGEAMYRALEHVYRRWGIYVFSWVDAIEFIVGSTDDKTISYIYGEAKRLNKTSILACKKPHKIIVVYTLNYGSASAAQEYLEFKTALKSLSAAAAIHSPPIDIVVKQFRPVAHNASKLIDAYDLPNYTTVVMTTFQRNAQYKQIEDLHDAVGNTDIIEPDEFETLIKHRNVTNIVDGIMSSEIEPVNEETQLLRAIKRAQIRIMAKGILEQRNNKQKHAVTFVVSLDNPSGMDENGIWTIDIQFWYDVDMILSFVWNKPLVNIGNPSGLRLRALVVDIFHNGVRLFDKLLDILTTQTGKYDPNLVTDVEMAQNFTGPAIAFKSVSGRMEVIQNVYWNVQENTCYASAVTRTS